MSVHAKRQDPERGANRAYLLARIETAAIADWHIMLNLTRANRGMIVRATQGINGQEFLDFCAQHPELCGRKFTRAEPWPKPVPQRRVSP